jgi:hypothetical protein
MDEKCLLHTEIAKLRNENARLKAAVKAEREACAKVAEDTEFDSDADFYRPVFAAAIRARQSLG